MDKVLKLRQERAALVKEARDILDKAENEKRDLTTEEDERYKRIMAEVDKRGKDIEREERVAALETELKQSIDTPVTAQEQPGDAGPETRANPRASEEYRAAFQRFLRGGMAALRGEETRALQAGDNVLGGYVVAPQQFVAQLLKGLDEMVFIRQRATKYTLDRAESLGVPSLDTDLNDADWTAELATGAEDNALTFGKRELRPHPLAKRVKISNKLLRQGAIDPEALVLERMVYKSAVTEEKAFCLGDGVDKPLGVFVATNQGISTARDVSNGNTATALTFDGLIAAKYALKGGYWPRAEWLFHRNAVEMLAKIKDTNGQYVWRESVRVGEPDRILSFPVMMSEYVPNTFTTGLYVGMLADFSFYWIVDALDMQIQRLVELYAETNQTGFIGRKETDGMPVLEEAFVRVKLA